MTCQEFETRLDELVDGELGPAERERAEEHLADCMACRRRAEATRALMALASGLPRAVEPARDLWPSIVEKGDIPGFPLVQRATGRRPAWRRYGLAAAASLAGVLLLASAVRWLGREAGPAPTSTLVTERSTSADGLPAQAAGKDELALALEEYAAASKLLLQALAERRERMPPEARDVLDKNLAVVDQAIAETQAALAAAPSNRSNIWVLANLEQQKLDFLRRVSRLASL